jgi:hypothetical protein
MNIHQVDNHASWNNLVLLFLLIRLYNPIIEQAIGSEQGQSIGYSVVLTSYNLMIHMIMVI